MKKLESLLDEFKEFRMEMDQIVGGKWVVMGRRTETLNYGGDDILWTYMDLVEIDDDSGEATGGLRCDFAIGKDTSLGIAPRDFEEGIENIAVISNPTVEAFS